MARGLRGMNSELYVKMLEENGVMESAVLHYC